MDKTTHIYLTQLRIISKIPRKGQLFITNNDIGIYKPSLYNWINRKISGDGKSHTTTFLMELFEEINIKTNEMIKNIDREEDAKIKTINLLISLTEKIYESLEGLQCLLGTYEGFPETVAKLEHIIQDMIYPMLKKCVNNIPVEHYTDNIISIRESKLYAKKKSCDEAEEKID